MLVRLYKNDVSIKGECAVYYDVDTAKFYIPAGQAYTRKGIKYTTNTHVGVSKTELRRIFLTDPYFSINMGKGFVRLKDLGVDITIKHFDIGIRKNFIEEYVPESEVFTLEEVLNIIKNAKVNETPEETKKSKDKNAETSKESQASIPSVSEFNMTADNYVTHQEYDIFAVRRELARLRDVNATLARKCKIEKEYAYLEEQLHEEREKNARLKSIILKSEYKSYGGSDES